MNVRENAAYIKRLVAREDAWKSTASQLSGLAERLYLQLPTCVITRVAQDGSTLSICASAVIYDTTSSFTSSTAESGANEKPGK